MKFYTPLTIRFRDLDTMAHVNNSVYFTLTEHGRIEYFNQVIGKPRDWQVFSVLVARNEINYMRPIHLHDKVFAGIETDKIGSKSIEVNFNMEIETEAGERIVAAEGKTILVCFDVKNNTSAPVPQEWIEKFEAFEGKNLRG